MFSKQHAHALTSREAMSNLPATLTRADAVGQADSNLAERLRSKGWTISSAALYLGVSRQRLYTVFEDPHRARLWECAITGMPECSIQLKDELRAKRRARKRVQLKPPPAPASIDQAPEFEVGDRVVALQPCDVADEGQSATITNLRGSTETNDLALFIEGPEGKDWFPVNYFYVFFGTTGLNIYKS